VAAFYRSSAENLIHYLGALDQDWAEFFPVDRFRCARTRVANQPADAALQICANFYPEEPVSPRSAAVLRELFG
jgi:hypothetical protein